MSFVSLSVSLADTPLSRLKGLLFRRQLKADEGIWVVPSRGIHTFGVLFPIDVIYLDRSDRVIDLVEHLGPFRVAPMRMNCATILELPVRSIYKSETQIGDQLLICDPAEISRYWSPVRPPEEDRVGALGIRRGE